MKVLADALQTFNSSCKRVSKMLNHYIIPEQKGENSDGEICPCFHYFHT